MARSRNPDLIFEDILCRRAERVSSAYSENPDSYGLDRVTLFVTHKCNLKCTYCNGPHLNLGISPDERKEMLNADITLEQYSVFLEDWARNGLRDIHFTGGEATLNLHLPDFIRLASEKGISSTLTTNGMASPELYRSLVDNGLSEIRISIDSTVDEEFDQIVGVSGASKRVKATIKELVSMRDNENKSIFVILNACIGSFNLDKVQSTLTPLIALNPDDVKFLVIAEQSEDVQAQSSRTVVDELLAYAEHQKPDFELLKKKIHAIFRKESFGINDFVSRYLIEHCFVPLTERTLDARGFYPCSIYLRYRGKRLAGPDASFEEQQKAINEFVVRHNCRDDLICRQNCTNCCKQFNMKVNEHIRDDSAMILARKRNIIPIGEPTPKEIAHVIETCKKIEELESSEFPFAIIKPQGLRFEQGIFEYLAEQKVKVVERKVIEDWQEFSLFLYCKKNTDLDFRIARNKAYSMFETNKAIYLKLENGLPEKKLARIKAELRRCFGEELGYYSYEGKEYRIISNCIHAPDYNSLKHENNVVAYFLSDR